MPIDVLYSYELVKREVGAKSDGKGIMNKIVNWYYYCNIHKLCCTSLLTN